MVVYIRELARNRRQFIVWTLSLGLFLVGMISFYPSMGIKSQMFDELMKQYPKELIEAFNIDKLSFGKILSYFAYIFQYIILFGGVYAMLLGSSVVSREESDRTIEFLLAKPIKRSSMVSAKVLSVLTYLVSIDIVLFIGSYISLEAVKKDEYSLAALMLMFAGFLIMQLTFASIGLLVSVFVVKAKTIYPISLGVVLGTYVLSIVSSLSEKLKNLKYLSPFEFVSPSDIAVDESIRGVYIVIMAAAIVVCTVAAYVFYNRKNITV